MGTRKVFAKTDLSIPQIEHSHDVAGNVVILPALIPPTNTTIKLKRSPSSLRRFDFARWYGASIDPITYACQLQIERFLAGQDDAVTVSTVSGYCSNGLRNFLDYCILRAEALCRNLTLADVNRDLTDGYLSHLAGLKVSTVTQKTRYSQTKPVLLALGRRGLIQLTISGDAATFPRNPFPNINRKAKGETPLSKPERQAFAVALRQAVQPIWTDNIPLTGELLAFALLVVALHTGRNTIPLLEMNRDCLHPHPKDDKEFLVLWKRRGSNSSKVALRAERDTERLLGSTPGIRTNVKHLIQRIKLLTEPVNAEAGEDLKGRMWLYRTSINNNNQITALNQSSLAAAINHLVTRFNLSDSDGKPLRINISRLRKTYANRIFELTNGDLAITAAALGNTPQVADQNYLAPDENARRNWQFMGEVLVQELLNRTIGATHKETPMGHCADPKDGQYAPKRAGETCMNFLNCLRCKHYAVTTEDLHKLFSFYFRVLHERSRMDKRRWAREYAHIPRLIDHYIVAEGVRRGAFKASSVEDARKRARAVPHPFWSVDLIESLEVFE